MLPADFRSAAAAGAEMIVKVPEPVPAAQDLVDQQVDGFGGSVADPAGVKVGQGRRTWNPTMRYPTHLRNFCSVLRPLVTAGARVAEIAMWIWTNCAGFVQI
jgi:hypothetical protein